MQRPLATVLLAFAGALILSQVLFVVGAGAAFKVSDGRVGAALFGKYYLVHLKAADQEIQPTVADEQTLLAEARVELSEFEPALVDVESGRGLMLFIPGDGSTPHARVRELVARHGFSANVFSRGVRFPQTLKSFVDDPLSTAWLAALSWILLPTPLAFLFIGWRMRRKYPPGATAARISRGRAVILGGVIGALAHVAAWLLDTALESVGLRVEEQGIVTALLDEGGAVRLAFIAVAVVLAPIGEELFFRGFAFGYLLERKGLVIAHVVSGGLFTAVHFNSSGIAIYLLLAVILAESHRRSGSLVVPVVAHGVLNAATVTAYLIA